MGKRKAGEGHYGTKMIKGVKYQFYRDANGKYFYGKTPKELRQKLEAHKEKENNELAVKKTNAPFYRLCEKWLKEESDISARTYDDYESIIDKRIKNYKIGMVQLQALDDKMFTNYFTELADKYSLATITKTWQFIRQVLTYGMEEKLIPTFPLTKIKRPKEQDVAVKKREVPEITFEDMELIYSELTRKYKNGNRVYGNNAYGLIFIMYSGVRISEMIELKWKDVASDFSKITIRHATSRVKNRDKDKNVILNEDGNATYKKVIKDPKSKDGFRVIPLPDRAIEALKYMHEHYPHEKDNYVFVSTEKTNMIARNVERTLEKVIKKCDVESKDITPHTLRHCYGSLLISEGVDIKIVSELLGHSKVEFTYNRYINTLRKDKKAAVENVFNKKKD